MRTDSLFFFAAIAFCNICVGSSALAGDPENGWRLARNQCAACHVIARGPRAEVADAPSFEMIGRQFGRDPDSLAYYILAPHWKMNFRPTWREANDIAAYIGTLVK